MQHDFLHSFPSQERDEAVFVFARAFWFAFLPTILIFLFIFSLTALGQFYASVQSASMGAYTANAIILGLGVFQLLGLIVFLVAVLDFYFDILIVTDRRLVDIDQEQLFYRKISELNLRDVEDVSFDRKGFFQTFLDYGTITIQTAGARENFVVHNVRFPSQIATIISDLSDQAKEGTVDVKRFPEVKVIGVLEGKLITAPNDLVIMEAMLPEDARRNYRHVT
ncbi:MAG TPA: hypothetical protein VLA04_04160 [Verrucomicrobiae bacterium]|nr:hypothetical protein [Verrucomicrobiae bacterium]